MTHSARSLASLLRDGLQTLEYRRRSGATLEDPDYLLLSQGHNQARPKTHQHAPAPSQGSHATDGVPTRQEVLNYLGELAKDYHLPPKLVYAVADAESTVDPNAPPHVNLKHRNGKVVHDKLGNPVIASRDYGLMQVNSSNIEKGEIKDAQGHPFKIGEDVKTDWKANARAGVALLAPAYRLAETEQGPGATAEDHAQQTYSQYNTGTERKRERYLKQKPDGMPENDADRNFLKKYRRW